MSLAFETIAAPRHARMAVTLGAVGAVSSALLLPYALQLLPSAAAAVAGHLPLFVVAQLVQSFVLISCAAWLGLRVGYANGLDAPLLRRCLGEGETRAAPNRWGLALALGVTAGIAVLLLSAASPVKVATESISTTWWAGLLASFYGASTEEIICRLLLVSLFVWCAARLSRTAPSRAVHALAIGLAAVLFGAAHLPQLASIVGHLELPVALHVVALNALCGTVFGWLFWRHGLEHAMVAHFATDVVLHVAAPIVAGA